MLKEAALLAFFLLAPLASAGDSASWGSPFEGGGKVGFQAPAEAIKNPEAVSYLQAEVVRSGSVYLFDNSPFQKASDLAVTLTLPQNTSRQRSFLKSVTGPDRHEIIQDMWGNTMIKLRWEVPELKARLYYEVISGVEVRDGEAPATGTGFPLTDMTKASPEIAQTAYDTAYGLDDMQRLFRLTEWVYKNIRYDNSVKSSSQSAKWTYDNRRGVCDEFSNLLVSMLRVFGYSPRYVVGYAYSETWGQHGWVEVDLEGKTVSLDPTWLESPADSTHIKLANLPDSNLTEYVEVKGGQITIDWSKDEPRIRLISHSESPKINIGATLIPENSSSGSHSLISTAFTGASQRCVLTKVYAKSCVMDSMQSFISLSKSSQTLAFCGSQNAYWFLKAPETEGGMVYTCPVIIYGGGAEKSVAVYVSSQPGKGLSTRVNSQSVLTPGQTFKVETVTENSGRTQEEATIYVFFGEMVQTKDFTLKPGESAAITWTLKAPASPGNYELAIFSSSGDLLSSNLTVVSQRLAQIKNVSVPDKAEVGKEVVLNVTVAAASGFSGILKIEMDGFSTSRGVFLGPSESKFFQASYVPQSSGTKAVSVTLLSDSQQYADGWWGTIEAQNEKQWWDSIVEWLQGIIDTFISQFAGGGK